MKTTLLIALAVTSLILFSCNNDEEETTTEASAAVPEVFSSNYKSAVTLSATTNFIILKSSGIPDHVTPYWGSGNANGWTYCQSWQLTVSKSHNDYFEKS
jgi:hypothetical protein